MKIKTGLATLAAAVMLTACSAKPGPSQLQCTVDDTLSFTAVGVEWIYIDTGILEVGFSGNIGGPKLYRKMLPGEVCQRVDSINWDLMAGTIEPGI